MCECTLMIKAASDSPACSQLRDLIVCPRERGVVAYVKQNALMEHNLNKPDSVSATLERLTRY